MNKASQAGIGVLVTGALMLLQWRFFNTPSTGNILALEFARTYTQASQAIKSWNVGAVIFNTVLDYAFLSAYGVFLFLAIQGLGQALQGKWGQCAQWLKWLGPIAAIFDAVENFLMLLFLTNAVGADSFASPFIWAWAKFILLFLVGLFYFIAANRLIDLRLNSKQLG